MKRSKRKGVIVTSAVTASLVASTALGVGLGLGINKQSQVHETKPHSLEQSNQYLATGSKLIQVQLDKKQYANKRVIAIFLDKSQEKVKNYEVISFTNANGLAVISTAELPNPGIYQLDHLIDPITNKKIITADNLNDQQKQEIVKPIFVRLIPNELKKGLGTLLIASNDLNFVNYQVKVSLVSAIDGKQINIKGQVDKNGNVVADASNLSKTVEYQIIRVALDDKIPTAIVNPYDLLNEGRINNQGNSHSIVEKDSIDRAMVLRYKPKSKPNQQTNVIQTKPSSLELESSEIGSSNSQSINDHSGSNANSELLVGKTNITQDTFTTELPSKVKDRDFQETERVKEVKSERESDQEREERLKIEKELEEARKQQQQEQTKQKEPESKKQEQLQKQEDVSQQEDEQIKLRIEEDAKSILQAEIRRLEEEKQRLIKEVLDRENAEKEAQQKENEAKKLEKQKLKKEQENRLAEQERLRKEKEELERLQQIKKIQQEQAAKQELELKQKIQEQEELQALEREKERLRKEAEAIAELLRKKEQEELAKKRLEEEQKQKEQAAKDAQAALEVEEKRRQEELKKAEEIARQKAQEELIAKREKIRIETESKKAEQLKQIEIEHQRKETIAQAARVAAEKAQKEKERQEAILREKVEAERIRKEQQERQKKQIEQREQEEKRRQNALRKQQEVERKTEELNKKKKTISDALTKLTELSKEEQDKFRVLITKHKNINDNKTLDDILTTAKNTNRRKVEEKKKQQADAEKKRQLEEKKRRELELERKRQEEKRIRELNEEKERLQRQLEKQKREEEARKQALGRITLSKEQVKKRLSEIALKKDQRDQLRKELESLKLDPSKEQEIIKKINLIHIKGDKFAVQNHNILNDKKNDTIQTLDDNKVLLSQAEYDQLRSQIEGITGGSDVDKIFDSIESIKKGIIKKNKQLAARLQVAEVKTYNIHKKIPSFDSRFDSATPLPNPIPDFEGRIGGELEVLLSNEVNTSDIIATIRTPLGVEQVQLTRNEKNPKSFKVKLDDTFIFYKDYKKDTNYIVESVVVPTNRYSTKNIRPKNPTFVVPSLLAKYDNVNIYRNQ